MSNLMEIRKNIEDKFREQFVKELGEVDTLGEGELSANDLVFWDNPVESSVKNFRTNDYAIMADWAGEEPEKYAAAFEELLSQVKASIEKAKAKMKNVKIFQKNPVPYFFALPHEDRADGEVKHGFTFVASIGIVGNVA